MLSFLLEISPSVPAKIAAFSSQAAAVLSKIDLRDILVIRNRGKESGSGFKYNKIGKVYSPVQYTVSVCVSKFVAVQKRRNLFKPVPVCSSHTLYRLPCVFMLGTKRKLYLYCRFHNFLFNKHAFINRCQSKLQLMILHHLRLDYICNCESQNKFLYSKTRFQA